MGKKSVSVDEIELASIPMNHALRQMIQLSELDSLSIK